MGAAENDRRPGISLMRHGVGGYVGSPMVHWGLGMLDLNALSVIPTVVSQILSIQVNRI